MSFKETRELEALPARIEALENEQKQIGLRLADPALYRDNPAQVQDLNRRVAHIEDELIACLQRWEELEQLRATVG